MRGDLRLDSEYEGEDKGAEQGNRAEKERSKFMRIGAFRVEGPYFCAGLIRLFGCSG